MPTITNNQNFPKIQITHVPTYKTVFFQPYIDDFSDNFNSDWDSTPVFGRMDDIKNFKRTKRVISLTWHVISEDNESARKNYENCSLLMAMLYPVYETTTLPNNLTPLEIDLKNAEDDIVQRTIDANDGQSTELTPILEDLQGEISSLLSSVQQKNTNSTTQIKTREASIMSSPPLFKVNFANLIRNSGENRELYGVIEGFKYQPDTEMGYFIDGLADSQMMYPKIVRLSFDFTVIHTAPLGWRFDEKQADYVLRNLDFPFYKKK